MPHELEGREYKLLIDPACLGDGADPAAIEAFHTERLRPIFGRGGGRTLDGRFDADKTRTIRFFDTEGLALDRARYALRLRRSNGGATEVTLKLRMPDFFVVAATKLPGRDPDAKTIFEEDIGPLEVAVSSTRVKVADPPSIRSRFALSTKQPAAGAFATLGDVFAVYPTLERNLGRALDRTGTAFDRSDTLLPGPEIRERVFSGPTVGLGDGVKAEVVLSHWTLGPPSKVAQVAEISYRCPALKGCVPGKAARAALELFLDLPTGLGGCLELRYPSKTALALPSGGKRPAARRTTGAVEKVG